MSETTPKDHYVLLRSDSIRTVIKEEPEVLDTLVKEIIGDINISHLILLANSLDLHINPLERELHREGKTASAQELEQLETLKEHCKKLRKRLENLMAGKD